MASEMIKVYIINIASGRWYICQCMCMCYSNRKFVTVKGFYQLFHIQQTEWIVDLYQNLNAGLLSNMLDDSFSTGSRRSPWRWPLTSWSTTASNRPGPSDQVWRHLSRSVDRKVAWIMCSSKYQRLKIWKWLLNLTILLNQICPIDILIFFLPMQRFYFWNI